MAVAMDTVCVCAACVHYDYSRCNSRATDDRAFGKWCASLRTIMQTLKGKMSAMLASFILEIPTTNKELACYLHY
jgi:hypothetical protein